MNVLTERNSMSNKQKKDRLSDSKSFIEPFTDNY